MGYRIERVSISEARKTLSDLMNYVKYQGRRIIITRRGKDLAVLVPIGDYQLLEHYRLNEIRVEPTPPRQDMGQ